MFAYGIVATISVLLVIMLVTFRSVPMAVRLAITIGITLIWCYGAAVIVFDTGIFSSANSGMEMTRALSWLYVDSIPLACGLLPASGSPHAYTLLREVHCFRMLSLNQPPALLLPLS